MLYLHHIYLMDEKQEDRYGQVLAKAEIEEVRGIYRPGNKHTFQFNIGRDID